MAVTKGKVWARSVGLSGVVTLTWLSPGLATQARQAEESVESPAAGGQIQSLSAVEALLKLDRTLLLDIVAGQAAVVSRTCSSSHCEVLTITSFNLFFLPNKVVMCWSGGHFPPSHQELP